MIGDTLAPITGPDRCGCVCRALPSLDPHLALLLVVGDELRAAAVAHRSLRLPPC